MDWNNDPCVDPSAYRRASPTRQKVELEFWNTPIQLSLQALITDPGTHVCPGCTQAGRSPMAEGVFRRMTQADERVSVIDSAGTGAYHEGCPPDPRTMSVLAHHGETEYDHLARKVRSSDFKDFDYILAMDGENLHDLRKSQRRIVKTSGADAAPAKVMLFGDFGGRQGEEVIDPYYGERDGFTIAYAQMTRFTKGFIEQVLSGVNSTGEA
ncbi:MAG: hypothetical protein LQ345_003280 [Seirophora villosa]|nr:MAG: hypothetical protein LQ345_003280 [Seirophora villosa]